LGLEQLIDDSAIYWEEDNYTKKLRLGKMKLESESLLLLTLL
jgi:hypothetical protein